MSKCDCKKNIEAKLLERFKQQEQQSSEHSVELQGYCLVVTDSALISRPYMPFKLSALYPLKKGGTKWKRSTQNMMFNYCPFCGVSLKEGETE